MIGHRLFGLAGRLILCLLVVTAALAVALLPSTTTGSAIPFTPGHTHRDTHETANWQQATGGITLEPSSPSTYSQSNDLGAARSAVELEPNGDGARPRKVTISNYTTFNASVSPPVADAITATPGSATAATGWDLSARPATGVAAETEGVLVEGAGSGTRTINFRPNADDPNWGLTRTHLDKHLFGDGPMSLSSIDPGGNSDIWFGYIQDLAGRPATATLKNGVEDIIGTFPRTGGGGAFQFGIRIAPGEHGTFDLVTLLTKQ